MFRSASQIDSERTASGLRRIKASWESSADSWFDGSVDSVDRRIALCERLIHKASAATGRLLDRPESSHYMKLASDLQADHQALSQMRRDLLTAAFDREAGGHNIGGIPDEYNDDYGPLPDQETLRREIAADERGDENEPPSPEDILRFWEQESQDPWRNPRRKTKY